jgi:hypothetical protein
MIQFDYLRKECEELKMKVVTKLVKMDFEVGSIRRDGDRIVISSDPAQSMPAEVYMTPKDVAGMIKASLNFSVIWYALLFPFLYIKHLKGDSG